MAEIEVDLNSPRFTADKHGYIEELRSQSFYGRTGKGVVFFNQDDAVQVLRCKDFRFSFHQITPETSPYLAASIEHELLNMHGAQHERLQKLLLQALRDRVVDGMKARITGIADALIDAMPAAGEVDFVRDLADPLPPQVLGPMFGVPYQDVEGLDKWIEDGGRKVDAMQSGEGIEKVEAANRNMHNYLRGLLAARRDAPGDDIFSQLMLAEIDGDRLSEEELVHLAAELASAGVDTTRSQLPLILYELLRHPAELAKLQADPSLAMKAVDEGMRFAPLPWAIPHAALHDFDYKGIGFKKGDLAQVLIPAVNRDPAAVEDPHVFDITRPRVRNFSFGYGMHSCPGAQLARMEMAIALERFIRRVPSLRLIREPQRNAVQKGGTLKELRIEIRK